MRRTRLRFLLDTLFACKRLAIIIPLATALVFALLGYFLSDAYSDINTLWKIPLYMLSAFIIVYWLLRGIMSIKFCPGWYVDTLELLILLGTGISAITQIINFFIDFQSFSSSLCICVTCWSAVSVAHNRRNIFKVNSKRGKK